MREYLKLYIYHIGLASMVAAIALPFIWITNTSANRFTIVTHAILMWVTTPFFMAASELILKRMRKEGKGRVLWASILYTLSLIFSASLMILTIHLIFRVSSSVLVVPALFSSLLPVFTLYLIFLFYMYWQKQQKRELELTLEKNKAAFKALSVQFKPHFFFNSLNTLEYLIGADPESAKNCVRQLAKVYRDILRNSNSSEVPISREIELSKSYLEMQKFRFEERLQVHWKVDNALLEESFPPNMLLNALENAIKHGVESTNEITPIEVFIEKDSNALTVCVTNHFSSQSNKSGEGFGLADIQERLNILYGRKASLNFSKQENKAILKIRISKAVDL